MAAKAASGVLVVQALDTTGAILGTSPAVTIPD